MKETPGIAGLLFLMAFTSVAGNAPTQGQAEHVVVIAWDGMRPDFVTPEYTPTLYKLSQQGVVCRMHHSVFITSTEVNGTVLATGVYPNRSHIVANKEYRPDIDPLKPIPTESENAIRKTDERERYVDVPTLEETLQSAGYHTVIAGTKAVALLADRSLKRVSEAEKKSAVFYAGKSIPPSLATDAAQFLGSTFPSDVNFPNRDEDLWTTRMLTEFLWKDEVPKFSLLWLSDPDFSQHNTAPGAPIALAALKDDDDNLAKVLAALDAKGLRDKTDIFIVSDHGFSTIESNIDFVAALTNAGFSARTSFVGAPKPGDVMVVCLGGSDLFYIAGHDQEMCHKLVDFLQGQTYTGVIFAREKIGGTFPLAVARMDSPQAPDIVISLRWSDAQNKYGVPGSIIGDNSRKAGQGMHATLSRFDVHNTLVLAGPDFKHGVTDDFPSGNVDVAPTILWILGVRPLAPTDGRVLFEAMNPTRDEKLHVKRTTLSVERNDNGIHWRQYLKFTRLGSQNYLDEGNGENR